MFRSFDLWFEYFKTLVTATIPDPDELDKDDNVFVRDTALEAKAQLYSDNRKIMQVKRCRKMQSYKTSQVGGRASQVGGITCIFTITYSGKQGYV